ncbi:MAG: RNA-binding S4 domain-containing protein [Firmicutes bacterium]|nr:RNA-binding S4 domain-containing protein [Bacillota bacterium]
MQESQITGEFIKLNQWLKKEDLAATGGEAKFLIEEGRVQVNGQVASEIRKKLYDGDVVSVDGESYRIQVVS